MYYNTDTNELIRFAKQVLPGELNVIKMPDEDDGVLYHIIGNESEVNEWVENYIQDNNLILID